MELVSGHAQTKVIFVSVSSASICVRSSSIWVKIDSIKVGDFFKIRPWVVRLATWVEYKKSGTKVLDFCRLRVLFSLRVQQNKQVTIILN
jgi:hypothetical protein